MIDQFDYSSYQELLFRLCKNHRNVCFRDAANGPPDGRFFILRHDIDFSPELAMDMAEWEARHDITATYFFLLSSPFYNLFDVSHAATVGHLAKLGHEVGLHYDVQALQKQAGASTTLLDVLRLHVAALEMLAGVDVVSISMHCPSEYGDDPFRTVKEFVNAYDPRFTQDIAYYSDSCGAWRNAAWNALSGGRIPPRCQLLIHPVFWRPEPGDRWERLGKFVSSRRALLDNARNDIEEMWRQHPGVIEHERRNRGKLP